MSQGHTGVVHLEVSPHQLVCRQAPLEMRASCEGPPKRPSVDHRRCAELRKHFERPKPAPQRPLHLLKLHPMPSWQEAPAQLRLHSLPSGPLIASSRLLLANGRSQSVACLAERAGCWSSMEHQPSGQTNPPQTSQCDRDRPAARHQTTSAAAAVPGCPRTTSPPPASQCSQSSCAANRTPNMLCLCVNTQYGQRDATYCRIARQGNQANPPINTPGSGSSLL